MYSKKVDTGHNPFTSAVPPATGVLRGRSVTMEEAQAHLKTAQVLLKYAEENYGAQSGEYMTALRNVHTCSKELEDVLDRFLDIDQIHQILGTLPKSSNIVLARDALFKNNTTNPFRDK